MSVFELTSIAALVIQGLMFWIILPLRSSIEQLRIEDQGIKKDLSDLKVEVAQNYVQRTEVSASLVRLEQKIDSLSITLQTRTEKLEIQKADK